MAYLIVSVALVPLSIGSEAEAQPFRMVTNSQDSPTCESSRRTFIFFKPSGAYRYAIL